ncbi:hypothetical protein GCM10023163_03150 [Aestuariibaculum suncheonense]
MFITCYTDNALTYGNYKLKNTNCYKLSPSEYKLCVDSVSDSRCPINVNCVWEGNAAVYFTLSSKHEDIPFTLNTFSNFKQDTIINGITFSLVDVLPYPDTTNARNQEAYYVNIDISDSE